MGRDIALVRYVEWAMGVRTGTAKISCHFIQMQLYGGLPAPPFYGSNQVYKWSLVSGSYQ